MLVMVVVVIVVVVLVMVVKAAAMITAVGVVTVRLCLGGVSGNYSKQNLHPRHSDTIVSKTCLVNITII